MENRMAKLGGKLVTGAIAKIAKELCIAILSRSDSKPGDGEQLGRDAGNTFKECFRIVGDIDVS
jgi:hypothetical protein